MRRRAGPVPVPIQAAERMSRPSASAGFLAATATSLASCPAGNPTRKHSVPLAAKSAASFGCGLVPGVVAVVGDQHPSHLMRANAPAWSAVNPPAP